MSRIENSQWKLSMIGLTAFILATIFYLITGPNIIGILSFLTSAIVLFIINVIHIFYINKKSGRQNKQV